MNDQHTAVLRILEKHCKHSSCGSLTSGQGFSYYVSLLVNKQSTYQIPTIMCLQSFSGDDGDQINFFIVPGSETGKDLSDTSSLYSHSMNWQYWASDLNIILLTGHCWAVESKNKKDPKLGDICVIDEALNTKEGEQDAKKPAAAKFAVVNHVCKKLQTTESGRWQSEEALITKRPKVSYKWQALWITRLHYELCKVKEGKVWHTC